MSTLDIAVVGSGYMGGGIAQVLALAGHTVRIADVSAEIAASNRARLIAETEQFVADGLFPADAVARVEAHLSAAASIEEAPKVGMRWRPDFVRGIGKRNGGFIIIPDLGRIFETQGGRSAPQAASEERSAS